MDFTTIGEAISVYGFPIVTCLILMWHVNNLTTKHEEESKGFTDALNKNTVVLQQLVDKLDELEDERKRV